MPEMTPERLADVAKHVAQLKAEAANCPQGEGLYWTQRDIWLRDMVDHIASQAAKIALLEVAGDGLRELANFNAALLANNDQQAKKVCAAWDAARGTPK